MFSFDRLDALCKQYGVSKSHLCRLVNKGNNYIQDSKKKQIAIPMDIVCVWATALHTTPEYLLGETDTKENAPGNQARGEVDEIINLFNSLDDQGKELFRVFLKGLKDNR